MVEHRKIGLRTKVAFGIAGLSLALAQLACGGSKPPDPCDEAFQALTTAFTGTRPGVIGDDVINVWPANQDGSASHPRVNWGAKSNSSWREVASFMRFNCDEQYSVQSLSADEDLRFYDDGVIIRKKTAQNFSLPELNPNWVSSAVMVIATLLGIGALGSLGAKKLARA